MNFVNNYVYPVTSGVTAGATTSVSSSAIDTYSPAKDKEEVRHNNKVINLLNEILKCLNINSISMEHCKLKSNLAEKRVSNCLCFKCVKCEKKNCWAFLKSIFYCKDYKCIKCCECIKCFNQRKNLDDSRKEKINAITSFANHIYDYILNLSHDKFKGNANMILSNNNSNSNSNSSKKEYLLKLIEIFLNNQNKDEYLLCDLLNKLLSSLESPSRELRNKINELSSTVNKIEDINKEIEGLKEYV